MMHQKQVSIFYPMLRLDNSAGSKSESNEAKMEDAAPKSNSNSQTKVTVYDERCVCHFSLRHPFSYSNVTQLTD